MELELEIFYHSEETLQKKDAGIDYSILECDTRPRTFYEISSITTWEDEKSGQWFCEIVSGDKDFIATKSYEEIKEIIHAAHERERSY